MSEEKNRADRNLQYWNYKLEKELYAASMVRLIINGQDPHVIFARIERQQERAYNDLIEAEKEADI
jgi:hypothetical protein